MEEFGVYAVFGLNGPPQKLLSANGASRVCVAVPSDVRQVVLFSSGQWEQRICVNAQLNDADRFPITIGKLTPYNKCLCWEQWEEDTWKDNMAVHVNYFSLLFGCFFSPLVITSCSVSLKASVPPLSVREPNNKRKRDGDVKKETKAGQDENICPNVEKTTPVRRVRGQTKRSQSLFTSSTENHTVSPSGRWGQTLCAIDAQTAILIGGQGARTQFCKDPMWKLCTEDLSWVPAETLAEGPTPDSRMGHTAVYDPDSKRIFVFGGSKNKKWFNDVHILDTQSWRWSMVEAQGKVPPLAYHTCSMFRGELFVLGGVFPCPNPEPDGCSDSLYIFDPHLSIWYQPIVTGSRPSPRSGHSACVMQERKIYMFGGWDTPICYNDMYMLDLGLMEFCVVKTSGTAPSPRSWHGSAALSDTKFLIHGGYNGNNALSDAFIFDTDSSSWTEVTLPQLSAPRAGHSIITMETNSRHRSEEDGGTRKTLLVFGGGDNEGSFYCDLTTVSVEDVLAAS
uniref:RING finger protein B-like n=1 Tax=Gouania willdenowi TaxID=441366 RepID=A0A8C5GPK7_GOUWI